jgi:hypothetical protein
VYTLNANVSVQHPLYYLPHVMGAEIPGQAGNDAMRGAIPLLGGVSLRSVATHQNSCFSIPDRRVTFSNMSFCSPIRVLTFLHACMTVV